MGNGVWLGWTVAGAPVVFDPRGVYNGLAGSARTGSEGRGRVERGTGKRTRAEKRGEERREAR